MAIGFVHLQESLNALDHNPVIVLFLGATIGGMGALLLEHR